MFKNASAAKALIGIFLSSFASGAWAAADDVVVWKNLDPWTVAIDTTLDFGCFAAAFYETTALRIGFNRTKNNAYIMIANSNWKSIEIGKDYKIKIQFDYEPPWDVPARAIDMNGLKTLVGNFSDSNFLDEFMRKQVLKISYNDKPVTSLNLNGTHNVTMELLECQSKVEEVKSRNGSKDPFSSTNPSVKSQDPFQ